MIESIKTCPFCDESLEFFGHDLRDGKKVELFIHPSGESSWERCPLSGLIFDLERWNTRPVEDNLRADNITLQKEINKLLFMDVHTIINNEVFRMKDLLLELKQKDNVISEYSVKTESLYAERNFIQNNLDNLEEKIKSLREMIVELSSISPYFLYVKDGIKAEVCLWCHKEKRYGHTDDCPWIKAKKEIEQHEC